MNDHAYLYANTFDKSIMYDVAVWCVLVHGPAIPGGGPEKGILASGSFQRAFPYICPSLPSLAPKTLKFKALFPCSDQEFIQLCLHPILGSWALLSLGLGPLVRLSIPGSTNICCALTTVSLDTYGFVAEPKYLTQNLTREEFVLVYSSQWGRRGNSSSRRQVGHVIVVIVRKRDRAINLKAQL